MEFIAEHGDDTARRYLRHTDARRPDLMREYQDHIQHLGGRRFTPREESIRVSDARTLPCGD